MLLDYHASKENAVNSKSKIDNGQHHGPIRFLCKGDIDAMKLVPERVLNIFHVRDDEKNLIVRIQFKNRSEPAHVSASWANENCPQLVIKFYESRIYWLQKT